MTDRLNDANFSAVAAIFRKDSIFLAKRSDNKQMFPGYYEAPGGHVKNNESFTDALHRELEEELGVKVTVGGIVDAYTFESEGIWKAEVMYLCELADDRQPRLNKADHAEGVWVTKEQLDNLHLVSIIKKPLLKAFEMIGGNDG